MNGRNQLLPFLPFCCGTGNGSNSKNPYVVGFCCCAAVRRLERQELNGTMNFKRLFS
jgi:hypothetical protein